MEGARIGAERIAWAMPDVLGKTHGDGADDEELIEATDEYRYRAGIGSRFESLQMDD